MKYCSLVSAALLAMFAGSALAQNSPALKGDGYVVLPKKNAVTFDGVISGNEWSEANVQQWGSVGLEGIQYDGGNVNTKYAYSFRLMWDSTKDTGGLYIYGSSDHGNAKYVNSSGGAQFGGGTDSANLYLDPNTDFETSNGPNDGVDGYQLAFNIAGPQDGTPTDQLIEDSVNISGDIGLYWEAHVNTVWGNNGGTKFGGNGQGPLNALVNNNVKFQLATHATDTGWSYEAFVPWAMLDGCSGGPGNDGGGLCVDSAGGGEGTVKDGDQWYWDAAYYIGTDEHKTATWGATAGGAAGGGFAGWPDPTIIFKSSNAKATDLNADGAVDAADAGLMFADWGGPGSTSKADFNKDGFVDAADAGTMFADWTGDPAAPGANKATAEYNKETGELKVSSAGAVNLFVQSAGGHITPLSPAPAVPVGLLTNNASRVGITNLGPITLSNFSFGNIGVGLAQSDLKLVYTPALGQKGVEIAAGAEGFKYIPEPASLGMLGLGLAGLLAARRRG